MHEVTCRQLRTAFMSVVRGSDMSRFEDVLLANIESSSDDLSYWRAKLDWAAYRVRVGSLDSVDEIITSARNKNIDIMDARLYSRINFVEGLYEFFDSGIASALPKLRRAAAIALGCQRTDYIYLLVHAWLASIYRNLGNWEGVSKSLITLVESDSQRTHEVQFRFCLVIGDVCQEIESYDQATLWYSRAREYALRLGDDAALSAMLYNRASILIYNLRLQHVGGGSILLNDGRIALEAASARNYTQYINDKSLAWGFDLMNGQLMMLKDELNSALELFTSARVEAAMPEWPEVDALRMADVFRCRVRSGRFSEAGEIETASALVEKINSIESPGDKAIAFHSIAIGLRDVDGEYSRKLMDISQAQLSLVLEDRRREKDMLSELISLCDKKFGSLV